MREPNMGIERWIVFFVLDGIEFKFAEAPNTWCKTEAQEAYRVQKHDR